MNEAQERQNTARMTHPSVPKGTQNFTCFCPIVAHFQGILGFSMGHNAGSWAQNRLKTLFRASQMAHDHFQKIAFFNQF